MNLKPVDFGLDLTIAMKLVPSCIGLFDLTLDIEVRLAVWATVGLLYNFVQACLQIHDLTQLMDATTIIVCFIFLIFSQEIKMIQ